MNLIKRPNAHASKRTCDMKMVQIAFGDNLAKPLDEELEANALPSDPPPKFIGSGKFNRI